MTLFGSTLGSVTGRGDAEPASAPLPDFRLEFLDFHCVCAPGAGRVGVGPFWLSQIIMGCGASTAVPPGAAKYAAGDEPAVAASKSAAPASHPAVATEATDRTINFDVFLSHNPETTETAARVNDWLVESGYRSMMDDNKLDLLSSDAVERQKANVGSSKFFVAFLSQAYFSTAESCLELCEAVARGVPIVLIVADGAQWDGKRFPALIDVPETLEVGGGGPLQTRAAAAAAFASASRIEHTRSYFEAFLEQLKATLGPPAGVDAKAAVRPHAVCVEDGMRAHARLLRQRTCPRLDPLEQAVLTHM